MCTNPSDLEAGLPVLSPKPPRADSSQFASSGREPEMVDAIENTAYTMNPRAVRYPISLDESIESRKLSLVLLCFYPFPPGTPPVESVRSPRPTPFLLCPEKQGRLLAKSRAPLEPVLLRSHLGNVSRRDSVPPAPDPRRRPLAVVPTLDGVRRRAGTDRGSDGARRRRDHERRDRRERGGSQEEYASDGRRRRRCRTSWRFETEVQDREEDRVASARRCRIRQSESTRMK